jgi:hypothetical protein
MLMTLLPAAALLAGCKQDDTDEFDPSIGERASVLCVFATLDLLPEGLTTTNPFQTNERVYSEKAECWNQTIDIEGTKSSGGLTRIDMEGEPPTGCSFQGTGDDTAVHMTSGGCITSTPTGHIRLALAEPADLPIINVVTSTASLQSVTVMVDYQEARGQDLIAGTGRIFLSVPMGNITPTHEYDTRIPVDPNASCAMPACSNANFAGKGTLLSGNPTVCSELLSSYGSPFGVYFDEANRMSFDAAASAEMRLPSVLDKAACGATSWGGQKPYPFRKYHLDPATGLMTIDEIVMHQANMLADVCTLHWQTTVTGC